MNALFISNTLINVTIVLGIAFSIYYTKNPMLIVGLYFLQPLPPLGEAYGEDDDESESHGQQAANADGDYANTNAGFTGTIKKQFTKQRYCSDNEL